VTQNLVSTARVAIKKFRQRKFDQEIGSRKLLDCLRPENVDDQKEEKELLDLKLMLYAKPIFFYFLDQQIGDPDSAASLVDQAALNFIPIMPILNLHHSGKSCGSRGTLRRPC